jgi:hypothetical protein
MVDRGDPADGDRWARLRFAIIGPLLMAWRKAAALTLTAMRRRGDSVAGKPLHGLGHVLQAHILISPGQPNDWSGAAVGVPDALVEAAGGMGLSPPYNKCES